VNEKAARVGTYNVWDYAEGQDSYQSAMLVDLTQPPEEVSVLTYEIEADRPLTRDTLNVP